MFFFFFLNTSCLEAFFAHEDAFRVHTCVSYAACHQFRVRCRAVASLFAVIMFRHGRHGIIRHHFRHGIICHFSSFSSWDHTSSFSSWDHTTSSCLVMGLPVLCLRGSLIRRTSRTCRGDQCETGTTNTHRGVSQKVDNGRILRT